MHYRNHGLEIIRIGSVGIEYREECTPCPSILITLATAISMVLSKKEWRKEVRNEAIRIRIEAVPRVVSNNTLSEDKSFIEMGVYQN